jgi:endonuclease/exonuclease/phosphatase family metal-dependent hydrolase
MKTHSDCQWSLLAAILMPQLVSAQVLLSSGAYTQDFNALINSGSATWSDNITLPGWYASKSVSPNAVTNYSAGTGSTATGALYSFGNSGANDRALGSLASGGTGRLACGIRFRNDTETAQTGFAVSYTGEQWRVASVSLQKLAFSYQIGTALTNADAPGDQTWTTFSALDFISPNTNATRALDGNDPANQTAFARIVLPGVVVPPGQELFLRWLDTDDPGYDDGLALDNLAVSWSPVEIHPVPPVPHGAFSVLSYNTHGNQVEDWSTNSWQVRAIGRQLLYLQPDIVAFNEIPETNTWQMENWIKAFMPGFFLATNSTGDGAIRNVIASRFPIARSQSWLHGSDLAPYGCTNAAFKRDLFEAEISVPGFPQPIHVFSVHLKSGQDTAASAHRAAEASAISNFFANAFLAANALHPYLLCGDLNEDLARPPASQPGSIQRLISAPTGLHLTTPLNSFTQDELTFSIQSGSLSKRYDYLLPCATLHSNIFGSMVFRTDPLTNAYPLLRTNDSRDASDHLPLLMVFNNPFTQPFRLISITRSNECLDLSWESVPGQVFCLEHATHPTVWTTLADSLLATGWTCAFHTKASSNPEFFRVRRSP